MRHLFCKIQKYSDLSWSCWMMNSLGSLTIEGWCWSVCCAVWAGGGGCAVLCGLVLVSVPCGLVLVSVPCQPGQGQLALDTHFLNTLHVRTVNSKCSAFGNAPLSCCTQFTVLLFKVSVASSQQWSQNSTQKIPEIKLSQVLNCEPLWVMKSYTTNL